ncbi:MAG: hypothetical protein SGBAC_005004 [Bacillariaceae sp.]
MVREARSTAGNRRIICIVLAVLLLGAIGVAASIVFGGRSSPSLSAATVIPTASPARTAPPKQLPTNLPTTSGPSSSPTRPLLYDPPTPEDCLSMANGSKVTDRDELYQRNFTVALKVVVLNEAEVPVLESRLQSSLQEYLIPTLAGCPDFSRRIRQRRLTSDRYGIGGGNVGIQCLEDGSCTGNRTSDVCLSCLMNLELLVKDESIRNLDIIGKISSSMLQDELVKSIGLDHLLGLVSTLGVELDSPTDAPSPIPSKAPSALPSNVPSDIPSRKPTRIPVTDSPTKFPTKSPTKLPTKRPTLSPTKSPTSTPTKFPTRQPTPNPTPGPTSPPTQPPTRPPTQPPTPGPTPQSSPLVLTPSPTLLILSDAPVLDDGSDSVPTSGPTSGPTSRPTSGPTSGPTLGPTSRPTFTPTAIPTAIPSSPPTSPPAETDGNPILFDDFLLFDDAPTDDGTNDAIGGGGGDDGTITNDDDSLFGGGDDGTIIDDEGFGNGDEDGDGNDPTDDIPIFDDSSKTKLYPTYLRTYY